MKYSIVVLFLLCLKMCNSIRSDTLFVKENIINFDSLDISESITKTIILENRSSDTIRIDTITTSCECVTLLRKINDLLPFQKDSIILKFTPNNVGYISRGLCIQVDDEFIDIIVEGLIVDKGLK